MKTNEERLQSIWRGMKNRCFNPKSTKYSRYGGRGITICNEWLSFDSFKEWALSNGYSDELTIDRIDNDCGYYPQNCRWTNSTVQNNNRSMNHLLELGDQKMTLSEWSQELGIGYKTLSSRVQAGWSDEQVLTRPLRCQRVYEIDGESHTLDEWSAIVGIPVGTLKTRMNRKGMSIEEAVQKKNYSCKYLTYDGKTQSISEWARETGINQDVISSRISRYGWSVEKALTTPVKEYKRQAKTA